MTVSAAVISLQYYTSYKSDLEYSLMEIGQRRAALAYESSALAISASTDPEAILSDDPTYQALSWQDKQYEQQQKTLETQLSVVNAQIQSYQQLVDNNTKSNFKINFGSGSS